MICPSCNAQISDAAKFCAKCGQPVTPMATASGVAAVASTVPAAATVAPAASPAAAVAPAAPAAAPMGAWTPPGVAVTPVGSNPVAAPYNSAATPYNRLGINQQQAYIPGSKARMAAMLVFGAAALYAVIRLFAMFVLPPIINMFGYGIVEYPVLILSLLPAILLIVAGIQAVGYANQRSSAGLSNGGAMALALIVFAAALLFALQGFISARSMFVIYSVQMYGLAVQDVILPLNIANYVSLLPLLAIAALCFWAMQEQSHARGTYFMLIGTVGLALLFWILGTFVMSSVYQWIGMQGNYEMISLVSGAFSLISMVVYLFLLLVVGRLLTAFE